MKKKRSKRIPTLSLDQMTGALLRLQGLHIDSASKQKLQDMLEAAANPDSQRIEVVVSSLPSKRRQQVRSVASKVASQTRAVVSRAESELLAIPDSEWEALVEEAARDE